MNAGDLFPVGIELGYGMYVICATVDWPADPGSVAPDDPMPGLWP